VRGPVRWIFKGAAIAVAVVVLIAVLGWAVMLLWNYLVPALFHGPQLGYWQAFALLLLCRILFGSLRGHRHHHFGHRRWRERWESLSPEERERLRQRFRERCGHGVGGAGREPAQP
jgi:membrane protease YdiL (CAAX protease family)